MFKLRRNRLESCHNIADLRELARKRLPAPMFHYIDGAADDEWTLRHNTLAFLQALHFITVAARGERAAELGEIVLSALENVMAG